MSDWRDDENEPDPRDRERELPRGARRSYGEGVRIIGADEAEAALETGDVSGRLPDDEPRRGDVPPRSQAPGEPAARFPLPEDHSEEFWGERASDYSLASDSDATWSASSQGLVGGEEEAVPPADTSGGVQLPHWTEPPTGEVPKIISDQYDTGDDLDAWTAVSGQTPRYRAEANDWADEDFDPELLRDDDTSGLGALDQHLTEPDDDTTFQEQVRARRRTRGGGGGRGRGRSPRSGRRPALEQGGEMPPPETGGPSADLTTRILTGVAMAVVALIFFKLGRGPTALLVSVIVGVAVFELYEAFRRGGYHPATAIGLLGSVAAVWVGYKADSYQLNGILGIIALVILFTMLWYMAEVVKARPIINIAITLFGFMYVGVLGSFAGLLLAARDGTGFIIGVAICAIGYDIFGYFVGSQFGRSRMAPRLSPNKTWEGLFGGMAASVILGGLVSKGLGLAPWDGKLLHGLALGLVVAVVAPVGDLVESMLKRDLGVKDIGTLLPGHGGVLDRFDAILFCLPAIYFLAIQLRIA